MKNVSTAQSTDVATQVPEAIETASVASQRLRYAKARAGSAVLSLAAPLKPLGQHGFGIINYHRVHPQKGLPLSVTPQALERQLRGLQRRGYRAYTVAEYVDAIEAGKPIPRKAFAITFDDAFDNVREFGLPILKSFGVRATAYVSTAFVGAERFPFDPLVYERHWDGPDEVVRPLAVDGYRELLDAGWEVGSHTHTHADFVDAEETFEADLKQSTDWLEHELAITNPTFSFPYGQLNERLRDVCRRSSIRCALTTECRLVMPGDDPFDWGRLGAEEFDTGASLVSKLNGWFTAARRQWRRIAYRETAIENEDVASAPQPSPVPGGTP